MAEIRFFVGKVDVDGIHIGPDRVVMTVKKDGDRLEITFSAEEAQGTGCGFIVGAHAAQQMAASADARGAMADIVGSSRS